MSEINIGDIVVMVESQDGRRTDKEGVVIADDSYTDFDGTLISDFFVDFGPERPIDIDTGHSFGHSGGTGHIHTDTGWNIRSGRLRVVKPINPPEPVITTPWWET